MKSLSSILKQTRKAEPPRRQGRYTSVRGAQQPHSEHTFRAESSRPFRRGRTMPGTTQQGLEAADKHALRSATPREKIRHLSYIRRVLVATLGSIVVAVIVLFIIVQQFSATIQLTTPHQQLSASQTTTYVDAIQEYLGRHPLERLRFNLHQNRLISYVQQAHPEVANVRQEGNAGFAATEFALTMRQPVVSWDVGGTRYYVDAEGVSFQKNYFSEPTVHIVDKSGVRYTPGMAIASERFLSFVGRVVALSAKSSLTVTEVVIPTGTTRQVELHVSGYDFPVIMSIERGPAEQVEDMSRALGYMSSQAKHPSYIDLRVKGKAFYREG